MNSGGYIRIQDSLDFAGTRPQAEPTSDRDGIPGMGVCERTSHKQHEVMDSLEDVSKPDWKQRETIECREWTSPEYERAAGMHESIALGWDFLTSTQDQRQPFSTAAR